MGIYQPNNQLNKYNDISHTMTETATVDRNFFREEVRAISLITLSEAGEQVATCIAQRPWGENFFFFLRAPRLNQSMFSRVLRRFKETDSNRRRNIQDRLRAMSERDSNSFVCKCLIVSKKSFTYNTVSVASEMSPFPTVQWEVDLTKVKLVLEGLSLALSWPGCIGLVDCIFHKRLEIKLYSSQVSRSSHYMDLMEVGEFRDVKVAAFLLLICPQGFLLEAALWWCRLKYVRVLACNCKS